MDLDGRMDWRLATGDWRLAMDGESSFSTSTVAGFPYPLIPNLTRLGATICPEAMLHTVVVC
jgi:hypothetical protein